MQTARLMLHTLPEWATMPPLRVFQGVFLLVLFLVASPPSRCNATVIGSTSSIATGTGEVTTTPTKAIRTGMVGADSSVVPHKVVPEYECGVGDAGKLKGLKTAMLSHADGTRNNCVGGVAMVDGANNRVLSMASRGPASDASVFPLKDVPENVSSVATSYSRSIVVPDVATFTAPNPYYGMEVEVTTNIPSMFTGVVYLLLGRSVQCMGLEKCYFADDCHNLTYDSRLPPPGTYSLCVTAKQMGYVYIPWGHVPIEVSLVMSLPRTFFKGVVPSVVLFDATKRVPISTSGWRMYLSICSSGTCKLLNNRERETVNMDACTTGSKVDLTDAPLNAVQGAYVLCFEKSADKFLTPVSLPVRVLEIPYSMEVVSSSEGSVKVQVVGGDIGNRKDKYAVCVVERGVPCVSEGWASWESRCSFSRYPNSETVDVDLSGVASGNVTLCLVSSFEIYSSLFYPDVVAERQYEVVISPSESPTTSGDESSNTSGDSSSSDVEIKRARIWIPILIAVLGALLLCGAICVICYLRRRKEQHKTAMLSVDDVHGVGVLQSQSASNDKGQKREWGSVHASAFYAHNAPYGASLSCALDECMSAISEDCSNPEH